MQAPITTLRELCAQHAPAAFDFLKADVEGAEHDVICNGDWQSHRPKIVVVEALAPFTLAPAWDAWEPILIRQCYRYACFDSLNRYYVAEEASELAACLENAPSSFGDALQFRNTKPALDDTSHSDHELAMLLRGADMTRLPLLEPSQLCELLTAGISPAALEKIADPGEIAAAVRRSFGPNAVFPMDDLQLPSAPPPAGRLCCDRRERPVPDGLRTDFGQLCLVAGSTMRLRLVRPARHWLYALMA